jgi:melibiose permease/lactose/raffinose/galactose permease
MKKSIINRYTFGFGAIGRDYVYHLITVFYIYYLTDVLKVASNTLLWITVSIIIVRLIGIPRDPILGMLVDNTRTKIGRFKPWIAIGSIFSAIFTVLLFTNFYMNEFLFIVFFLLFYLLWDTSYSLNDVAYLALIPTLSLDQKEREKITTIQRIFSYIGTYMLMVCIIPLTSQIATMTSGVQKSWFFLAVICAAGMIFSQAVTFFGVDENSKLIQVGPKVSIKKLLNIILKNDQLMIMSTVAILFNIANFSNIGLWIYYFKYIYGNEVIYSFFSFMVGLAQIITLIILPVLRSKISRSLLYKIYLIGIMIGYLFLFFQKDSSLILITVSAIFIYSGTVGSGVILWMFLVDSIDYGHWKMGNRYDGVTVSVFSFLNKMGSALSNVIVSLVIIISGIKNSNAIMHITNSSVISIKLFMTLFPAVCILCGYILYTKKFKIDSNFHSKILEDLQERGAINL